MTVLTGRIEHQRAGPGHAGLARKVRRSVTIVNGVLRQELGAVDLD